VLQSTRFQILNFGFQNANFGFPFSSFNFRDHPCRCLCFGFSQITLTTPARRTILHFVQIFLTDERTFISTSHLFESRNSKTETNR